MAQRVEIYDVTLRDGAQGPGVKFSSEDQLRIVQELDAFGISCIEGGQPGSNPASLTGARWITTRCCAGSIASCPAYRS